jgi:hypothetical protein
MPEEVTPDLTKLLPRGAIPSPRHELAAAMPHVPDPKISVPASFLMWPIEMSSWDNYVYGDCVSAEEAFAKATAAPQIFIPLATVVAWAQANGYLNGASLTGVMTTMQTNGFPLNNYRYNDGPYNSVNWTNAGTLQSAIYSHGPVKIGVGAGDFQSNAHGLVTPGTSGWAMYNYPTGQGEDHCTSLCGYGTLAELVALFKQHGVTVNPPSGMPTGLCYAMFTWNSIGIIDAQSMLNMTYEAWIRNPVTSIVQTGHPWFLPNNAVKMQVGATVSALWRSNDTHLDLFATGNDGAVWSNWWEAAHGWQSWFLVNNAVKMQPGATVTALWRSNDTHLDLFATGNDGAVWSNWWEAAHGWQSWFLVNNAVKMQPGATVTALWRSNDTHLDLFVTGNDGAVWSNWWEAAHGWQSWFLVNNAVKMQRGATVTALWRSNDTHLDLFATGNDGAVWSTWWEAAHGWQPWFLVNNAVKMQPGATVTALWRSNDTHLDLFATGNDGAVWSTWWEAAHGWQPWFLVNNAVKMKPGATVTALWRSNDTHLDLFATGTDGTVWSTWWEAAHGWQQWFPIWNAVWNNVKMEPGVAVTGLWRSNDTHLDLFATGTDGAVWSIWWEAAANW